MRPAFSLAVLALSTSIAACGGSEPPAPVAPLPPPPPAASSAPSASASALPPPPAAAQEEAHKLVILAASCWFGGAWADALSEEDQMKQAGIDGRCHDLERAVWGADDKTHYEQMRALEQQATSDVVAKVDGVAKQDAVDGPRRDALVKVVTALADATRETMEARRAADRVKRDLNAEPDKLTTDETDAVGPLRAHAKIGALLGLDAGDLTKEANALGLLCVLDRVELARGLPKHLKLYAAGDALSLVFPVPMPDVPMDGTKKLVPGTWLKFLTAVASASGHPVPPEARTPRQKDAMAWAGMLEAVGDKLEADGPGIATTTPLSQIELNVQHRLDAAYEAQQAALATEGKPAKGSKKQP